MGEVDESSVETDPRTDASVSQVVRSLVIGALPSLGSTAEKERIPKSLIPQAIGYLIGIAALIQVCRGNVKSARAYLATAWLSCAVAGSKNRHLMPGMGAPHHALALLELGDFQTVLKGIAAGEMSTPMKRYVQTGALSYIEGRALAMSSQDPLVLRKALSLLEDCHEKSRKNFKWWRAAALQEVGVVRLALKDIYGAQEAFHEELKIATSVKNQFKLLEVDALIGLARCEMAQGGGEGAGSFARKALSRIQVCGFALRKPVAEKLLREA